MKTKEAIFNNKMPEDIILKPIISERSYENIAIGKYTFKVAKDANKFQIKNAVEKLFEVDVVKVNTQNYKGKPRRVGRHAGYKNDWKKAIVTLKEGQSIKIFDSAQ